MLIIAVSYTLLQLHTVKSPFGFHVRVRLGARALGDIWSNADQDAEPSGLQMCGRGLML